MTSAPRPAARLLGLDVLLFAALAVVVFLFVSQSMADPDIWWHLRDAEMLCRTHHFITQDSFSFTAHGSAWMNHEWLAELPFYLGWTLAGTRGLYAVTLLTIEAIMFGVLLLAWQASRSVPRAVVAAMVGTVFATVSFGPRTLLFGWLLLVVELALLQQAKRQPALLWALPLLFAMWVNTHGSWLIGLVLLAIFTASHAWSFRCGDVEATALPRPVLKRLLLCAALSVGALFVNPYGWRLVVYPFNLAYQQKLNIGNVDEWKGLDFHTARGVLLLLCLAFLALRQLCRSRRWSVYELLCAGLAVYSAFKYSRFLFLAAILLAPVLACSLPALRSARRSAPKPLLNAAILFLLLCLVWGRMRHPDSSVEQDKSFFPVAALPKLQALAAGPESQGPEAQGPEPQGRLFNEYTWGGYLEWYARQWPVFIDSRADIFEYKGTFQDYLDIVRVHGSLELLDKYHIRYVLFEKETPLVYLLRHTGGWKTDAEQGNMVLLERTGQTP